MSHQAIPSAAPFFPPGRRRYTSGGRRRWQPRNGSPGEPSALVTAVSEEGRIAAGGEVATVRSRVGINVPSAMGLGATRGPFLEV
jgi:hypothetical protein